MPEHARTHARQTRRERVVHAQADAQFGFKSGRYPPIADNWYICISHVENARFTIFRLVLRVTRSRFTLTPGESGKSSLLLFAETRHPGRIQSSANSRLDPGECLSHLAIGRFTFVLHLSATRLLFRGRVYILQALLK